MYEELIDRIVKENTSFQHFSPVQTLKEQKVNRKKLTSYLIGRYIRAANRNERADVPKDVISQRYFYSLSIPINFRVEVTLINRIIREFVIDSPQVQTFEEKGKHIVRCLFLKFMEKDKAKRLLPDDWKGYLPANPTKKATARVVSDYLAGMTDDYAQKLYAKLYLPRQGSVFEVL